jgi:outer membrane lipoprotein-sorting protein
VKLFRTLPTSRLLALVAGIVVVIVAGGAIAVAARGGAGSTPSPEPLETAIHDALAAPAPAGLSGRVTFTNKLFPSGALTGNVGSALMSGASGRFWADDTGGRIELQSDAGDVQVTWNGSKATVYDASSNTAYTFDLPQHRDSGSAAPPSLDQISTFLGELGKHWTVSGATPDNIGGQPAYDVRVSPSHDGGLLGSAELAWDATHGVPLKLAVYAQGASSPVLALEVTDIAFGPVSQSDIDVTPPAGSTIVDLSSQAAVGGSASSGSAPVTGLAAVQAAAPFAVVAPDTLVGLPRQDIRLVGGDRKAVVAVYGEGLGAVVVVERGQTAGQSSGGAMDALPSISLDGVTAHELATQLGTILTWDRGGVSYVLAGSVPSAAAEAAARALT